MALRVFLTSFPTYFGFQSLLIGYIVLGVSSYLVLSIVYNLYLHPLAALPGPLHCRASILPWAYHTLRGNLSFALRRMHENYGPIVRISPSEVSFSDPSAWKDVYGVVGGEENAKHHKFYSALSFNGLLPDTIIDADKESHRILKASMTDGLSDKTVRRQEDLILKHVDTMLSQLRKKNAESKNLPHEAAGVVVDMTEWCTWLVFDTIADLLTGQSLGCLANLRKSRLVRVLTEVTEISSVVVVLWHVGLKFLVVAVESLFGHQFLATLDEIKTRVLSRRALKGDRDDLMNPIIRAERSGDLSFDQVLGTATTLMIAATDTTTSALLSFAYFVTTSPGFSATLAKEIRSSFPLEQNICLAKTENLRYLNACIKECLRIHPPAPMGFPRVVTKGGRFISGHFMPEDTVISVDGYCTSHLEQYFKAPFEFHPERYLGDPEYKCDTLHASQPFSLGPHSCPGRSVALAIMRLTIAKLVWSFDFEEVAKSRDWATGQRVHILWKPKPLLLRLKPRDESKP